LFVALPGEHVDGNDYAKAASDLGASLVLASREIPGVPSLVVVNDVQTALGALAKYVLAKVREANPKLQVVALTGSQGKTTTKDLVAQLVAADSSGEPNSVVAPKGSFNNEIGLPLTVLRIEPETDFAVLEMGADHKGNIADLTSIAPPAVGMVLTVGTAHIETFGSQDGIAEAKSEMVTGTLPGGTAILNLDDHRVARMHTLADQRGLKTIYFGRGNDATVQADKVTLDTFSRASFDLVVRAPISADAGEERHPVSLHIPGEHHVSNALAAASAALVLGIPPQQVAERLSQAKTISPHRMAVTERDDGITIIDDAYNANPESMRAALQTLASIAGHPDHLRRAVAIIGAMRELGETGADAHDEIGHLAAHVGVSLLLVIGHGARASYEAALREEGWGGETMFFEHINAAREALPHLLRTGDVVLVKASNGSRLWELADELSAGDYTPGATK
jgi:UDP-N-acetylmuramoyl-tripeptide--D-alanyl-D-alanine ligase